jgi:hypothetical protein
MENALYYTFSTIAQTLAGILAVMVAFILLGLQRLDQMVLEARALLRSVVGIGRLETCWADLRDGGVEALDQRLRTWGGFVDPVDAQTYQGAVEAWALRVRIARKLRWSVVLTLSEIAICFGVLTVTPSLKDCPLAAKGVLVGALLPAIACLGFYFNLIMTVVDHPPVPSP